MANIKQLLEDRTKATSLNTLPSVKNDLPSRKQEGQSLIKWLAKNPKHLAGGVLAGLGLAGTASYIAKRRRSKDG